MQSTLKTHDGKILDVEELTADDVGKIILNLNPELSLIMSELNPAGYRFYKASYPFGSEIISNGKCYLPLKNGNSIAFDDERLPDILRNDLSYGRGEDPLGLVISKTSEFYLSTQGRIQPQSIIQPGQIFGIPRAIDNNINGGMAATSALLFNLNAGSRSLFMLSKISDQVAHGRIQDAYGVQLNAPRALEGHYNVFVKIAHKAHSPWRFEVIYFSRPWINKVQNKEWPTVYNFLQQLHCSSYSLWHNMFPIWINAFHDIEARKHLTGYPIRSLDMTKQLFRMASNSIPGFRPATNDESAPISLIQKAYITEYNRPANPKYNPIIMEPAGFNFRGSSPIYYSLNHPTFKLNLDLARKKSQLAWLDEVQQINNAYSKEILENMQNIESLYDIAKNTQFSYYHSDQLDYANIKNAELMAKEDPRFTQGFKQAFPTNSPFFKGCIKISPATL